MKRPKLIMTKGLSGSGKSTWAKAQQKLDPTIVRTNKDEFRSTLHCSRWSKSNEQQVIRLRDFVVEDALSRGRSVIVDDTGFEPKHEVRLRELAAKHGADFEVKVFDTPLEQCIENDLKRPVSVGEKVIRRQWNQYLKPPAEVYPFDPLLPTIVLCDIDGTLAHMTDRRPYDWAKVGSDALDVVVSDILTWAPYEVILFSGRDEVCRPETEQWLALYNIRYQALYMRPAGDIRKDAIVKRELFDQHIRGQYNVHSVFDDRNQVVDMWRAMGLKVFQPAYGDF